MNDMNEPMAEATPSASSVEEVQMKFHVLI